MRNQRKETALIVAFLCHTHKTSVRINRDAFSFINLCSDLATVNY